MPPETSLRPTETWLVCPSTLEQTDQYWQAVSMCRAMGIELELHPLVHSCELPWKRLRRAGHWQGLVLWPDATGQRLCRLAQEHGCGCAAWCSTPGTGFSPGRATDLQANRGCRP